MRRLLLVGALSLCGCATLGSTALQDAEKALTAAHAAHDAAAVTLTILANTNVIHGATATTAKGYLDQSEADLKLADAAVAAGQVATAQSEITAATALVQQVAAVTGGSK